MRWGQLEDKKSVFTGGREGDFQARRQLPSFSQFSSHRHLFPSLPTLLSLDEPIDVFIVCVYLLLAFYLHAFAGFSMR